MQIEIANGHIDFKAISENTSHEADYDGITGFMYSYAKRILITCWKYGHLLN